MHIKKIIIINDSILGDRRACYSRRGLQRGFSRGLWQVWWLDLSRWSFLRLWLSFLAFVLTFLLSWWLAPLLWEWMVFLRCLCSVKLLHFWSVSGRNYLKGENFQFIVPSRNLITESFDGSIQLFPSPLHFPHQHPALIGSYCLSLLWSHPRPNTSSSCCQLKRTLSNLGMESYWLLLGVAKGMGRCKSWLMTCLKICLS